MFIFANFNQIVIKIHSVLQYEKEIYNHFKNFVKVTCYLIWRKKNNSKRESKFFHTTVQSLNAVSWQIFRENSF